MASSSTSPTSPPIQHGNPSTQNFQPKHSDTEASDNAQATRTNFARNSKGQFVSTKTPSAPRKPFLPSGTTYTFNGRSMTQTGAQGLHGHTQDVQASTEQMDKENAETTEHGDSKGPGPRDASFPPTTGVAKKVKQAKRSRA